MPVLFLRAKKKKKRTKLRNMNDARFKNYLFPSLDYDFHFEKLIHNIEMESPFWE